MLDLIERNKAVIEQTPVDIKQYEHLNLCADYKAILQHVGGYIDFGDLGVMDTYTDEDNAVGYLFQQVRTLETPVEAKGDDYEYANKLFYEIGRAKNGDSLIQIHSGASRGKVMLTDHETFPTKSYLEEEIGDLDKLSVDELLSYLNTDFDCLMFFEKIDVENVADFLIKKLSNIPYYEKPDCVPAEAEWVPKYKQWRFGQKDSQGNPVGHWKNWLAPEGHLVCETWYGDNKDTYNFTRYHQDGTVSQKGNRINNINIGLAMWQGSENPTTENWLKDPVYKCEAEYDNGTVIWVKYWNKEGAEIDYYGNLINP